MTWVWIAIAAVAGFLIGGWLALIVQSLATLGKYEPYFAGEMILERDPEDDYLFELGKPFPFVDSNGVRREAPEKMKTDGASVEKLLRIPLIGLLVTWLIQGGPLEGPLAPAAVPHDYIYGRAAETSFWRALISMERAIGDRLIFELARCRRYVIDGKTIVRKKPLASWRAFAVMALLRVFGAVAWIEDSRASRSLAAMAT